MKFGNGLLTYLINFLFLHFGLLAFAKAGEPPEPPPADPDAEFWEKEGVKDDDEKDAIRSRARVIRYANYREKREAEAAEKERKGGSKGGKPWYKKD